MVKVFTPEQREEVKARIVELVRRDGRKTRKQLENETGATRHLIEVLAKELVDSGVV
ncbi:TPA: DUF977 family protein, partial [Escherichia coli]|nr:DUF977 family protein [Escherichia coli]HBL6641190.1 DUF977 family protein [Escherichia coli]